ncbi:MAG TPA: anthranilate synthase component 1 [Anaerohalosphaeraceae bacterium]|nr:anthranilate synthase component 1 [Phycisphaerae bacterium]HOK95048.1 anthranilate synthase component 1 [Anaerohalosphaeraceae bacterium]HOM76951.1 anthranilate synthase component 1 [Anaerohalosphaeraceae bacterium]HPC63898.1 anthranilate synthase component 1 [Anaerohalosphaeraceae bacterium]HPO68673.1 anthranilate synthase component 1 [Anaerohalosphaeraceae bacterium]
MNDYKRRIEQARPGQIIPMVRDIDITCPVEFFAKLSNYGRSRHCCLLESRDYLTQGDAGELTFGTANPALYLTGTGRYFMIKALTETGSRMLQYFSARPELFSFCQSIRFDSNVIEGHLAANQGILDEEMRLKSVNQMDIIRTVAFAFELASKPFRITCGLMGAISYDFIDQFEKLPTNQRDILHNPDYELYFADNIFLMDHKNSKGYVIVNAVITDGDRDLIYQQAQQCFDQYFDKIKEERPIALFHADTTTAPSTDTQQEEYEAMVKTAQKHILDGDIFQVVLSRTITEPCPAEPLDVYRKLRTVNPSPYMFYLNTENTILMGASPELNLRVSGTRERIVEIRPIAGTKPRGRKDGKIDPDTDVRYEAELKLDRKELAEHIMLVDLARNDIARVAEPGSRIVNEMLIVERYESVMHLVSNVRGRLRNGLDALSAYLATMNMGTLTGAPKIEAMKIIRMLEKTKRGYYGGAVMYLTVDGQFDSCITIRSMQIRNHQAYVRAGAGIVHDSIPRTEFEETEHKAQSCLKAIRMACEDADKG